MKKIIKLLVLCLSVGILMSSCGTVVQPNYGGVLMQNYGKAGKSDYSEESGRVSDWGMGTQLFQVPLWQQRASVEDTLHMQDSKNNVMTCFPRYAYKVTKGKLVDVVFNNSQIAKENSTDGTSFLKRIEDNVLEMAIYDIIKEQSRKHLADSLMNNGGSLKFEKECEDIIRTVFAEKGFTLEAITIQLTYSNKIMETLDKRLEVSTNVSTLDQEIIQQRKKNELEQLRTEFALIQSKALTPEILEARRIAKWDGHLPSYYGGGGMPLPILNSNGTITNLNNRK
jgi:hypothetical protein